MKACGTEEEQQPRLEGSGPERQAVIYYLALRKSLKTYFITTDTCLPAIWGFPGGSDSKVMQETRVDPWVKKMPWRREWLPTSVFLPGKSHGQGSLAG